MLKNRKMKIKIFTFNLTQFDNAMLLRVDEAGAGDGSVLGMCCSCRDLIVSSQHPHWVVHSYL